MSNLHFLSTLQYRSREDNALESLLKKVLGEVLSGLYKQLQALRPKVSYGMGGFCDTQGIHLRELNKTAK